MNKQTPQGEVTTAQVGDLASSLGAKVRPLEHEQKPAPKPVKPATLLEKIRSAGKKLDGGKIADAIDEAREIMNDQTAITTFVETMVAVDKLATMKSGALHQEANMCRWWSFGLPAVHSQLATWANAGDAMAKQLLETLNMFRESKVDVVTPLWRMYTAVIRPASNIRSYFELRSFMYELVDKGLVKTRHGYKEYPQEAIVVFPGTNSDGFLPALDHGQPILTIQAAWPWLQEAEERAKGGAEMRKEKFRQMQMEAPTTPLTPAEAEKGLEGKVFLEVGHGQNKGALLQITNNNNTPSIHILQSVGLLLRPTGCIGWNAPENVWPDASLYRAFQAWKHNG